jgi:prepilin-type N-terminal cleavage/methylation domain-containing protein
MENKKEERKSMKMFKEMREQKGFTLIELAIVLVIIGIIIGAVLKGQDLIESARIKRFDNSLREWETAVWTYVDRKGTFPGDSNADGIIGNTTTENSAYEYIQNANFINEPDSNPMTIGSLTWFVFFGNDGATPAKNIMLVCSNVACDQAFDDTNVKYAESFDTVIDGTADGTAGNVLCITSTPTLQQSASSATYEYKVNGGTFTTAACSTSTKGMVYYFDRGN